MRLTSGHGWAVLGLMALAAAAGLYKMGRTDALSEDSVGFIRYARQLGGEGPAQGRELEMPAYLEPLKHQWPVLEVLATHDQHPGYPALILATHRLGGAHLGNSEEVRWMRAGQLVGLVAGVLVIGLVYLLGRELYDAQAGLISAAAITVAPQFFDQRVEALSDMPALACLLASAFFGVRLLRHDHGRDGVLCALAGGLGYLIRPETCQVALAAAGVFLLRRSAEGVRRRLGKGLVLGLVVVGLAAPYWGVRGGVLTKSARPLTAAGVAERQDLLKPVEIARTEMGQFKQTPAGEYARGLAKLVRGWANNVGWPVVVLSVAGLLLQRRRLWEDAGQRLILLILAANTTALPYLLFMRKGYLDHRHAMPLTVLMAGYSGPAACWLAGLAARWLQKRQPKLYWAAGVAVLVAGLVQAVPTLARPLHQERVGYREAGDWLSGNLPRGATLLDTSGLAGYHAGRDGDNRWAPCPRALFHERLKQTLRRPGPHYLVVSDRDVLPQELAAYGAIELSSFAASRDRACPYRVRVYRLSPPGSPDNGEEASGQGGSPP